MPVLAVLIVSTYKKICLNKIAILMSVKTKKEKKKTLVSTKTSITMLLPKSMMMRNRNSNLEMSIKILFCHFFFTTDHSGNFHLLVSVLGSSWTGFWRQINWKQQEIICRGFYFLYSFIHFFFFSFFFSWCVCVCLTVNSITYHFILSLYPRSKYSLFFKLEQHAFTDMCIR